MNEAVTPARVEALRARNSRWLLLWGLLPLAMLALAIAWLLNSGFVGSLGNGAPPVENLTFERTILGSEGIEVLVRAGGSEPMTIAQVQVDDAYWQFVQDPPGKIARGDTAWLHLPFPWVRSETHERPPPCRRAAHSRSNILA